MKYKLKNSRTGQEIPEFNTEVNVTFTEKEVVFEFYCENSKLYSASNIYNDSIYRGDVCEVFICTNEDRKTYYEVEIAPNGTEFLYKMTYQGFNKEKDEPILIAEPIAESFLNSKVEVCGNNYKVKFSVPLEKVWYDKKRGVILNIFRIETEGGYTDKNLLALSPTLCDKFHHPEFFVEINK